jgi:hypothetical protein
MRQFKTGATRDDDSTKIDFDGFLSPAALMAYAKYMHENRVQADGNLRSSDNWKKGIPQDAYMKSMWRHFFSVWENFHRKPTNEDMETALCALMFNVQGMLHEVLAEKSEPEMVVQTNAWEDEVVVPNRSVYCESCCRHTDHLNEVCLECGL